MVGIVKLEISAAIRKLDGLKSEYPTMKTQDVIDMLKRLKVKL